MINLDETIAKIKSNFDEIYIYGDIDDVDAENISTALSENNTNTNLTTVSLRRCKISDNGLKQIMMELVNFPMIKLLSFELCYIQRDGAQSIANLLFANKSIEKFTFTKNCATEKLWSELTQSPILSKNEFNSWIEIFAPVLAVNKTIKIANLSNGQVTDAAAELLAVALKSNNTLQKLDIGYSQLSTSGMQKICMAIGENYTLKEIHAQFCGNPMPDVNDDSERAYQFHSIAFANLSEGKCHVFKGFDQDMFRTRKRRRLVFA